MLQIFEISTFIGDLAGRKIDILAVDLECGMGGDDLVLLSINAWVVRYPTCAKQYSIEYTL